jgi:hypothetical protein
MVQKFGKIAIFGAVSCLSGCYEAPPTAWSTVVMNGYYANCPTAVSCVVSTRNGMASVAHYGNVTTVAASAGHADSAVATDGTSSAVVASAGSAHAAVGTSGTNVGISTSAGGSSTTSLGADISGSHGSTGAGDASISW